MFEGTFFLLDAPHIMSATLYMKTFFDAGFAGRGRIICGNVGESKMEALYLIEKGANLGWNNKEGTLDYCTFCRQGIFLAVIKGIYKSFDDL